MNSESVSPKQFTILQNGNYSRCNCRSSVNFEQQCVHEIALYRMQFKDNLFAHWHHRRDKIDSSSLPEDLAGIQKETMNHEKSLVPLSQTPPSLRTAFQYSFGSELGILVLFLSYSFIIFSR